MPSEGKSHTGKRVNVTSYIAQFPLLWTARSALYTLLPWQTCSIKLIWEIFNHAAINARCLLIQISATVYSQEFIDTAVKTLAQSLTSQCKTRTRVLLVENPKLYPRVTTLKYLGMCHHLFIYKVTHPRWTRGTLSVTFASRAYATLTLVGRTMHRRRHITIIVYSNHSMKYI